MRDYQKPVIVQAESLAEGIYLASGTIACQSQYMNGVWHKPNTGSPNQQPVIERHGCEGCSADDGDGCKIAKGKGQDLNPDGIFKPTWEQEGKLPTDIEW